MKFKITQEWLARKLAESSDADAGAGGTDIEQLKKDAELRTVSPAVFSETRSELGKVVRFIREQRGWTRQQLADIATMNESEVEAIETEAGYALSPRAVIYLADALGLSKDRLKELVGFVVVREKFSANDAEFRFAAKSKGLTTISDGEYDAVRALVEILSDKKS